MHQLFSFWSFIVLVILTGCQQKNKTVAEASNASTVSPQPMEMDKASTGEEWTILFDGVSGGHWRAYGKDHFPEAGWTVNNGALTLLDKSNGGTIITKETYENFDLQLDFKLEKGANSGIFYLVQEIDGKPAYYSAPEYQLIDDAYYYETSNGDEAVTKNHLTGDNYDLQAAPTTKKLNPAGQWNTARIVLKDGQVKHYLNGDKVVEYTLWTPEWKKMVAGSKFAEWEAYGKARKGHIGLQDHGDMVSFKNIKIKRL